MKTKKIKVGKKWMRAIALMVVLVGALLVSACMKLESDLQKQQTEDDKIISDYLTNHHIDAIKDYNGFYYQKLSENASGEKIQDGDVVDFYYTMRLLDSTLIGAETDTSACPARFLMNYYSIVPKGLYYGIGLMKTGEKYRFFMPSWLSFNQFSTQLFGSNSNFIIDVEVLSRQSADNIEEKQMDSIQHYVDSTGLEFEKLDDGLYYRELKEGSGMSPQSHSQVTFNFTRRYLDSSVIATSLGGDPVTLTLGEGKAVKGLEEGIMKMKEGGKSQIILPEGIGFKESVCVVPESVQQELFRKGYIFYGVKPYSIVMYDVELIKVE